MSAAKKFPPFQQATDWFTIAKSDTVNFVADTSNNPVGYTIACIYVGTTGDVAIVSATDTALTFKNVPSGTFLPVLAKRVNSANTTASDMIGLVGLSPVG